MRMRARRGVSIEGALFVLDFFLCCFHLFFHLFFGFPYYLFHHQLVDHDTTTIVSCAQSTPNDREDTTCLYKIRLHNIEGHGAFWGGGLHVLSVAIFDASGASTC